MVGFEMQNWARFVVAGPKESDLAFNLPRCPRRRRKFLHVWDMAVFAYLSLLEL